KATKAGAAHVNVQLGGGHADWPNAIVELRIIDGRRTAYFIASFLLRLRCVSILHIGGSLVGVRITADGTPFGVPKRVGHGQRNVRRVWDPAGGGGARMRRGQQGAASGREMRAPTCVTSGGLRFPPTRPQRTRSPFRSVRNI